MSDSSVETKNDVEEKQKETSSNGGSSKNRVENEAEGSPVENNGENKDLESPKKTALKRRAEDEEDECKKKLKTDNTVVVAEHYNSVEEKGSDYRCQSRIVHMRNFNNWMKSMLTDEFIGTLKKVHGSSLTVLDMCCGKGGDLLKWEKLNITHLICADIAEISVEQCENRYKEMVRRKSGGRYNPIYTVEFIAADCTKVRLREKFKDPSMKVDAVSCQFAFHYCFESLGQAECMLKNASENLKAGGYFIGTIPNAYELVSRWQNCDGNKFGNEVYSIEFYSEDKTHIPLFGAKYNFHLEGVVDCPEFLVHIPTLTKLALKFGLELILFERFDKFYERKKSDGHSLLERMQALQSYSPSQEPVENLIFGYDHAAEYMKGKPSHFRIGTLSKAEWEAITLYAVFAFQKMKTTWNSEGKPEYSPFKEA